jgi:hypothetical protein
VNNSTKATPVKPYDSTRWAVAYSVDGAPEVIIGFTARKTRRSLLEFTRDAIPAAIFDQIPGDAPLAYSASAGIRCAHLRVYFTGYTERDYKNRRNGPGDADGPRPVQAVIA